MAEAEGFLPALKGLNLLSECLPLGPPFPNLERGILTSHGIGLRCKEGKKIDVSHFS